MAQPARWTEQALLLIIQVIKAFSTGATFIMTDTPIHVFLSHGLESGPGSTKIQAMKAESETFPGIQAHAIDHSSTRDPATRLAQMREACGGDLDRLDRVVKLTGFVNCTPDFRDHPGVVNGASELFLEVLGDAGRHARFAVGVNALPFGVAVEVEALFALG